MRLARAQWLALVGVPLVLALLVALATHAWSPTWAVVLGPLAGGYLRDWQSCCRDDSLSLLPGSLVLVAVGLAAPVLEPSTRLRRGLRWLAWIVALLGWFGAAIVSYLHALE